MKKCRCPCRCLCHRGRGPGVKRPPPCEDDEKPLSGCSVRLIHKGGDNYECDVCYLVAGGRRRRRLRQRHVRCRRLLSDGAGDVLPVQGPGRASGHGHENLAVHQHGRSCADRLEWCIAPCQDQEVLHAPLLELCHPSGGWFAGGGAASPCLCRARS